MDTTLDGLLDRRVALEQPAKGYRVAVDTVLLAAAVAARPGQSILDLGCGVGGAMLALACRVPELRVTGLEVQASLAAIGRRNIQRNGAFAAGLEIVEGRVEALPESFHGVFDGVMMNPPFHDTARHDTSPDPVRELANAEKPGDLEIWIRAAMTALREGGTVTLIHRADRVEAIVPLLASGATAIRFRKIVTSPARPPKRALVSARRAQNNAPPATAAMELPPLILQRDEGAWTPEADALLRAAQPLDMEEGR